MGIYDREYVRAVPGPRGGLGRLGLVSFNSWLIIVNIAVFVLGPMLSGLAVPVLIQREISPDAAGRVLIVPQLPAAPPSVGHQFQRMIVDRDTGEIVGSERYAVMDPLQAWGHFSTARAFVDFSVPQSAAIRLEVWRFITFQFLHASFLHLLFNMFGLWVFGGMVEEYLGSKRYAAFYLVCGIFGAIAYLALNFLGNMTGVSMPGFLPGSIHIPLIGASAGVFGVIMAGAFIAPGMVVQLLFPPIPLRLRTLAYAYVGIAALNLLMSGRNAGGDAAHLGGAVAGFFFIRQAHLLRDFFDVFGDSRKKGPRRPARGAGGDAAEVDRILSKVATQGLHSLSEGEKRALRRATEGQRRP